MKHLSNILVLCVVTCSVTTLHAGGGLFRRGGCSDPCTALDCASVAYHLGYCGGSPSMSGVAACDSAGPTHVVHHPADISTTYIPSSYAHSGYLSVCDGPVLSSQTNSAASLNSSAISAGMLQQADLADCGPVVSYQVVMQTEYATETQQVAFTDYRDEIRYRTRIVNRQVPVEVDDYRIRTVFVPKSESKTVEYNVLVPQHGEKSIQVTESVPVWDEIEESYTVKVPTVIDVSEQYMVRVPQLRDETFTYTVQVPQTRTEFKIQRVTNAVPVMKTRMIQVERPITKSQLVTRDMGHWEMRVEEVVTNECRPQAAARISIGGCGTAPVVSPVMGCGGQMMVSGYSDCNTGWTASPCGDCGAIAGVSISSGPTTTTVTRRVWVPNLVTEEVPVVENILESHEISYTAFEQQITEVPYECVLVTYQPEQRIGTRKTVDYIDEPRIRTRKQVQYHEEPRTRTIKQLSYKLETREQKIPFVSYTSEKRSKELTYIVQVPESVVEPIKSTRYETVQDEITEEYTVRVPFTNYREQQVQVAKVVPKLVPITINPCQELVAPSAVTYGATPGCTTPASSASAAYQSGVPTLAPCWERSDAQNKVR